MKIGFIGLGIMGKPMAKNMLSAGHELLVHDVDPARVQQLVSAGATAGTIAEIGAQCPVALTMLPNSPEVKQVVLGPDGLAQHMKPGTTLIDMSSINPVATKDIAAALAKKSIHMLDAPVSGGEPKAIDGSLAFMVGGDEAVFAVCKPLLCTMGASVVLCGAIGAGNTTKLANQIIVACNIQALAEALSLAQKAGVDPACVFEAIKGGLAGSTVMDAKAPMMLSGNSAPGFTVDLHCKDLNNALDCAHAVGAPLPMTAAVQQVLQWLRSTGNGRCDHSAIAKYYEHLTGLSLGR